MPPEALAAGPASFHAHLGPHLWMDAPRSGWDAFDDLRLLAPGRVVLFDVAQDAAPQAARLLAGLLSGGVAARGRALLVEAREPRVEARLLAEAAEEQGLRAEAVLASVRVARAPGPKGLQALLEEGLPAALAEAPVGLALVTDLPEAFVWGRRRGLKDRDALARGLSWLRAAARLHDVPLALATSVLSARPSHALRDLLLAGVDEAVSLHAAPDRGLRIGVPARGVTFLATPGR